MMNNTTQSKTPSNDGMLDGLCVALRRQFDDARIGEMLDNLKRRGHTKEAIVARVMQTVGADGAARVHRIASTRAQQMATGTWQRYRMSRTRRLKLWLRHMHDSVEDAIDRLRG